MKANVSVLLIGHRINMVFNWLCATTKRFLGMGSANERKRYNVAPSLIGQACVSIQSCNYNTVGALYNVASHGTAWLKVLQRQRDNADQT